MVSIAPIPHGMCGSTRHGEDAFDASLPRRGGLVRLVTYVLSAVIGLGFQVGGPALAQDPSIKNFSTVKPGSSFPSQPGGIFGEQKRLNNAAPLYLQGDDLIYDTKGGRVIARGNVQIFYNNYLLTGDKITYEQRANKLIAEGNVQLRDPNGNITRAERIDTTDDFRDAFVESLSIIARDETRIQARRSIRRDGNVTEFEQGKFTPCKSEPGQSPLWCISAARIVHDQQAATITYQDAAFEIFGTPVLYLPYFQHPDPSVKHKSGFLTPVVGYSGKLGFSLEVPYYFAFDRSYGFTFNPRYYSKQGVLWQGDWRQRTQTGQYSIKFGVIDQNVDDLPDSAAFTPIERERLNGFRGTLETRGQFSLGSWWKFGWDVTLESDASFRRFYGFDNILQTDRVNVGYLTGLSDRNYFNASLYQFGGLLPNDTQTSKAWALPVFDYNYIMAQPVLGGELSFNGHARVMQRSQGVVSGLVSPGTDTTHVVADVNWRRKLIDPIGQTWTPFANVRADFFTFDNALVNPAIPGSGVYNDTMWRGIGSAGLTYAYPFVAHTPTATHTIEPIAQVVTRHVSQRIDQRLIPNEDARSIVFDDNSLFFESKSTGFDRIDEGTRFNYGTKYTFQASNGFNARVVLGQSLHLAGSNVFADAGRDVTTEQDRWNFSLANGLERRRSDYVAGLYVSPLANLSLVAQGRFDTDDLTLRRQDTLLSFGAGPLTSQIGYSYTRAETLASGATLKSAQEIIGAVGLKLTDTWSIMASMRYDIDEQMRLQDAVQIRYADDCFVLSATYSESFIKNDTLGIQPDRTVMLRFELKHLGSLNTRTDVTSFLSGLDNQTNK